MDKKYCTNVTFLEIVYSYFISKFPYLDILMENALATHSSTLDWKIPWMEAPGWLQSMGSLIVGHN